MVAVARPFALIASVTLLIGIAMLTTDAMNYRAGWNLLWMLAIPFGVARLADRGDGVWPLAGLYLLLWSLLAMITIGALLGVGS